MEPIAVTVNSEMCRLRYIVSRFNPQYLVTWFLFSDSKVNMPASRTSFVDKGRDTIFNIASSR